MASETDAIHDCDGGCVQNDHGKANTHLWTASDLLVIERPSRRIEERGLWKRCKPSAPHHVPILPDNPDAGELERSYSRCNTESTGIPGDEEAVPKGLKGVQIIEQTEVEQEERSKQKREQSEVEQEDRSDNSRDREVDPDADGENTNNSCEGEDNLIAYRVSSSNCCRPRAR